MPLEDRCVRAGGWVDWADVGDFGGPVGDSLYPNPPSTGDVITFTLHDDDIGNVYEFEPRLRIDLAAKFVDVEFVQRPEPIFYGGFYVQGVWGQLWDLEPGTWTLNGPDSSITFTVNPELDSRLTINDVSLIEGDGGSRSAVFTVSLSVASEQTVTVHFATGDGTAISVSGDYAPTSGMLTFAPGETTKTIMVQVHGDLRDEYDETFFVVLSNATNATIVDFHGMGVIQDDDAPPTITISDVTLAEGHSGTTNFAFTVSLSVASEKLISVSLASADGSAKASAGDYVPASGFLTLWPGRTSSTVTVKVNGDRPHEFDETFVLNLSNPSNATLGDSQGLATILNDDAPPALRISDVMLAEGRAGMVTSFVFTVTLSAASDKPISINFAIANGTATTTDNDFVATSGKLTFEPGETRKTITVQVKGDKKKEANETFFVNLSGAVNALLADSQGVGTILNDD